MPELILENIFGTFFITYQIDFLTVGNKPVNTRERKTIRDNPKTRYTPLARFVAKQAVFKPRGMIYQPRVNTLKYLYTII